MKKALFIFLFFLLSSSSFGQRIRFSDSTNEWKWLKCEHYILPIICNSLHTSNSGSVYFDTARYVKHEMSYVREDTTAGIVYIRYFNPCLAVLDTVDRILYNYNWGVGDTLWAQNFCFGHFVSWVTAIDSTKINSQWHKVWHFQGTDTQYISSHFSYNIIEGIGCTNGFDYAINPYLPFENSLQLICFSNRGNTDSLSIPVSAWGINGTIYFNNTTSCNIRGTKVNEPPLKNISTVVIPNPIDHTSKILFPYNLSGSVIVLNSIGQVVVNMPIQDKEEVWIGDKIQVPGIYFYRVLDNQRGEIFSRKFIKE